LLHQITEVFVVPIVNNTEMSLFSAEKELHYNSGTKHRADQRQAMLTIFVYF
jgi:hypothetical protein